MAQPERKLSYDIMTALRAEGFFCWKNHGNEYMMSGLPDIAGVGEGIFFGLETKMPGKHGDTSPKQDLVRDQIREAGGLYAVVTSPAEAVRVVRAHIKELLG